MMLFKLSSRNIKQSFKDYMIYFVTLIIGVAVFYVFNAMEDQTIMLKVSDSTHEIIDLMNNMMSAISVFVSFVLGFLIVYASNFLLKRRKGEFGIYMLLGMGKRRISLILLIETMLIGLISLAAGLLVGVVVSQGMSVVVANMFEADMTEFSFIVSKEAIGKTILYFMIMYVVVLLLNTFVIGKAKLINLISAKKKNQQIRIGNPWICLVVFIIAGLILASAYYNVTANADSLGTTAEVMMQIIKGIVGTFLVFWSLSGMLLFLAQRSKGLYYKRLHVFTVKELSSRINTTVFSGSIICLMLFITICVLSSALSIKKAINDNLKTMCPVDVNFYHYGTLENKEEMHGIADVLQRTGIDENMFQDVIDICTYLGEALTMEDILGEYMDTVMKKYPSFGEYAKEMYEEVIYVSDYNRIARLYGNKQLQLAENEYVIVCNYDAQKEIRDEALKLGTGITIGGKTYKPKYRECQNGFLTIASNHTNMGFLVVPDSADLSELDIKNNYYIANYAASDEKGREEIDKLLLSKEFQQKLNPEKDRGWPYINVLTKKEIYDNSIGMTAMIVFIGIYLGIVFMLSGAAILALKQLSETSDSKEKYTILRRIGADENMIRRSLFQQSLIFFGLPLLLAIVHSIFGIQVCIYILETFGKTGILFSILVTGTIILAVYGIYFVITYLCSRRIISE